LLHEGRVDNHDRASRLLPVGQLSGLQYIQTPLPEQGTALWTIPKVFLRA
jgi:hypothetical protein